MPKMINFAAATLVGLPLLGTDMAAAPAATFAVSAVPVPDGGTSIVLLGLSFVGLLALRKKFSRK